MLLIPPRRSVAVGLGSFAVDVTMPVGARRIPLELVVAEETGSAVAVTASEGLAGLVEFAITWAVVGSVGRGDSEVGVSVLVGRTIVEGTPPVEPTCSLTGSLVTTALELATSVELTTSAEVTASDELATSDEVTASDELATSDEVITSLEVAVALGRTASVTVERRLEMTPRRSVALVTSLALGIVEVGMSLVGESTGVVSEAESEGVDDAVSVATGVVSWLAGVVGSATELAGVVSGTVVSETGTVVFVGGGMTTVEGSTTIVLAMMIVVTLDSDSVLGSLVDSTKRVESEELADEELTNVARSVKLASRSVNDVVSLLVLSDDSDPPSDVELDAGEVDVMVMFMYCRFTWRGK